MALPVTITNAIWPTISSGNVGPFISSGGNVYAVASVSTSEWAVYKATDPTDSFAEQDSGNRPFISLPDAMYCKRRGDIIYIATYRLSTGITSYSKFDMSSDTWQVVFSQNQSDKAIYDATDVGGSSWVSIDVRSNGDVIIFHPGEAVTDMGQDVDSTAYSRFEIDGVTSVTDGTNGLEFTTSGIIRSDGGSWITDGFTADSLITITDAEDAGNNGVYQTTAVTASILTCDLPTFTTNAVDTTVTVTHDGFWTTGIAVHNQGAEKGQRRRHGFALMDTNDRCMFACQKEEGQEFLIRPLNAINELKTERSEIGDIDSVKSGGVYSRSGGNRVAIIIGLDESNITFIRYRFDEFGADDTDWTSGLVKDDVILSVGKTGTEFFTTSFAFDPNDADNKNYHSHIVQADGDLQLRSDSGGDTWGDENSGTEIMAGTFDGVSANIFVRDGNKKFAYLVDDAGTTKYNEFDLGAAPAGGPLPPYRPRIQSY